MIAGVFGLPGSGKSVFLSKIAFQAQNGKSTFVGSYCLQNGCYDRIYTNFPIQNCYKFDFEKLGHYNYTNSLFLIDEIMMYADSRNFKSFSDDLKFFFSQHRKFKNAVVWCSQSYDDTDKKIRNLTNCFCYIRPFPWFPSKFSYVSPINPFLRFENGQIMSGYELAPPIQSRLIYLPKYWNLFDSYSPVGKEKKNLVDVDAVMW